MGFRIWVGFWLVCIELVGVAPNVYGLWPWGCAKQVAQSTGYGDLTATELQEIMAVTDLFPPDVELNVVGGAARGERRNVGTDLPLGKDPYKEKSDIDYVIRGNLFHLREHLHLPLEIPLFGEGSPLHRLPDISEHGILRLGPNDILWKPYIQFRKGERPRVSL